MKSWQPGKTAKVPISTRPGGTDKLEIQQIIIHHIKCSSGLSEEHFCFLPFRKLFLKGFG
jgi:hypothetical protein